MKRFLAISCLWLTASVMLLAQRPAWVDRHPVSDTQYIGVGVAAAADANHVALATDAALSDIAAQIATHVETNAFMHTVDVDGHSRELFEEEVRRSMTSYLEGHKLEDSYSDGSNYYVRYSLDKKLYDKNLKAHRQQAIRQGLDYWREAQSALSANSLSRAVQLLGQGLDAVSPWTFADLTTTVDGRRFDVPAELYRAYLAVFDGLAITVSDYNVEGEAFKPIAKPLGACLSRDGVVVPNVVLKAAFVKGGGEVTAPVATDYNGTSEFYVTNITSKTPVQELRITIDDSFIQSLPASYRALLQSQTWPEGKITIQLTQQAVTAYINVSNDDLPSLAKQVAAFLTNNHFTVTEDPDAAQVFIDLGTSLDLGGVVAGEMYDLNECHASLAMKFYDSTTQNVLLNYTIDRQRVLVPANKSVAQTEQMCVRELLKRVKNELPGKLKKLNIN